MEEEDYVGEVVVVDVEVQEAYCNLGMGHYIDEEDVLHIDLVELGHNLLLEDGEYSIVHDFVQNSY